MFKDKTLVCKDCGQEFTFTANEQDFFAEKGFTNEPQRVARRAVIHARATTLAETAVIARCSTQYVQHVENGARSLLSRVPTALFIAAIASEDK